MNELTKSESTQLKVEENIIKKGQSVFMNVGLALARVRDGKLYRALYDTFEGYCSDKWGWGRQRAYQIIEAAEVAKSLPENVKHVLQNSRQAQALSNVPESEREAVLKKSVASGSVTASSIKAAAKTIDAKLLDKTGMEVPEEILKDWNRAENVQELLTSISQIRCAVKKGIEEDIIFAELSNHNVSDLDNAYTALKHVIPFAVCSSCSGKKRKGCQMCLSRGFVSESRWKQCVPSEIKEMRSKIKRK